jgi:N-methylhydantoinase B
MTTEAKLDPISIEVQWSRLISIMDEVDIALVQTAFSTIVRDTRDFAVILLDRQGRSIAQSQLSSPAFTVTLPMTTKHLLAEFPVETLRPGDVLVTNDSWLGAGHLPDVNLVMPVFNEGEVVAFMGSVAHVADIGGRLDFFDARDSFEEGLNIPPSKLHVAGEENGDLVKLIRANVRVPDIVMGDLEAMIGAMKLGDRRLQAFLSDYGGGRALDLLAEEILSRSDRAMRRAIGELPDGVFEYGIDCDGYKTPLHIHVKVTKTGEGIEVDFAGSSQQFTDGSVNVVPNDTFADTHYPLKCSLVPHIPNNEGLFRALTVKAPEGSVFNATRPHAVRSRSKSSFNIHVAVYGALAGIMPDRIQAGSGAFWSLQVRGRDPEDGTQTAVHMLPWGGKGATARADGLPTTAFPYNGTVTPTEVMEYATDVIIRYKRLVEDSGGPGRWRGGLGQEISLEVPEGQSLLVALRPDKVRNAPPGILGGAPGGLGAFDLNGKAISSEPRQLEAGDIFTFRIPGGGGYGNPHEREPYRVQSDLENGYISRDSAIADYGYIPPEAQ